MKKNYPMAKEWLKASKYDLEVIEEIIDNPNLTHMVAFHAQQALEKTLKSILELYNQEIPKIHNIKKLINLTKDYFSYEISKDTVIKIDTLYIESRYPGDMGLLPYGQPTIQDAKEFYKVALKTYQKVDNLLTKTNI